MPLRLVADIETDGLLDQLTKMHSLVIRDADSRELLLSCTDAPRGRAMGYAANEEGLQLLSRADTIYFHNGIKFDIPAIHKLYPRWVTILPLRQVIRDTLVVTQFRWAHIKDSDYARARAGKFPAHLAGSHSLMAWGYRLGNHKGEYTDWCKEQGLDPWAEWRPEMQTYCEQDTDTGCSIVEHIRKAGALPAEAMQIEHDLAWYLAAQERNGWPFNIGAAAELQGTLSSRRQDLADKLIEHFGWWYAGGGEVVPKRSMRRTNPETGLKESITEGSAYTKLKVIEFNPGSRQHIADRLIKLYGWEPESFTPSGQAEVSETTLKGMDFPVAAELNEYLMVEKRLGQLSEGKEAWLRHATQEGPHGGQITGMTHIHGRVKQNHAITHRASHVNPNLAQVPAVGAPYGADSRALFTVPEGESLPDHLEWPDPKEPKKKIRELDSDWLVRLATLGFSPETWVQVGCDASGLELRCLAHYMARFDGGAYGEIILGGDIHTANQHALELPDKMPDWAPFAKGRDVAKRFIYAFLYGAGDELLGQLILPPGQTSEEYKRAGAKLRRQFQKNIPAMGMLVKAVQKAAASKGYLLLPDGRRAYIRHQHAALNTLLQGSGSIICKKWITVYGDDLTSAFGPQGWRGRWAALGWIHDENQIATRSNIASQVGEIMVSAIRRVGEQFAWRCALDGEFKIGSNWKETH